MPLVTAAVWDTFPRARREIHQDLRPLGRRRQAQRTSCTSMWETSICVPPDVGSNWGYPGSVHTPAIENLSSTLLKVFTEF